jgi:hypothetical protein
VGVTAALFPPVGIGIAAAGGAGAGGARRRSGEPGGRVRVHLADQVGATIKAANRVVSKATDMAAEEPVADLKKAEESAAIPGQRQPESAPKKAETTRT